jgi:hypothetical protein
VRPLTFTVSVLRMTLSTFWLFALVLLLAPAVTTGLFAFSSWRDLARPWTFVVVGCVVLYLLAAAVLIWVMTDVATAGIPGRPGESMLRGPPHGISPATKATVGLIVLLAGGSTFLWYLRRVLSAH